MPNKAETRPRVLLINRAAVINEKRQLLLLKRVSSDRWAAGLWEAPGGKLEEGQAVTDALEREVMEEAGLLVSVINRLAHYESKVLSEGPYAGYPYVSLTGIAKIVGNNKVHLSEAHEEYVWETVEKALTYNLTVETRKALLALEGFLSDL